ncbi:MAG: trimethylamine methyltransferase family protein [Thermoplasmata archaeon]
MGAARMRFLDRDEEELVHSASLECLEDIGVLVRSPAVLKLLEKSGAAVDSRKGVARLPRGMVEDAIARAPKTIRLHARNPEYDLLLPVDGPPHIATSGLAVYVYDHETHTKRPSTRKDIAAFGKLTDSLDAISYFWPTVTATEVLEGAHSLHELWTALWSCTKHVQGVSIISADDARAQIELGACIAGNEEELRRKPCFSVICCTIAPLSFERGAVEGQVELARGGIPVVSMSMSLAGMSSPVTIAGTIVNANCENLASLVITQCASPGAPHIYSSESAPVDMTTGCINYLAPETPVIAAALGQMARRYGLPCMTGSWGFGGEQPGIPETFADTFGAALLGMANTDIASGMGSIDAAKGASLEQAVLDSWLWEDVRPYLRSFRVDRETIALDVIKAVGPGGTFLTHPHTGRNFRKELFIRDKRRTPWQRHPPSKMVEDARELVRKILKEHQVPPLDPDVVRKGDEIIKRYETNLLG